MDPISAMESLAGVELKLSCRLYILVPSHPIANNTATTTCTTATVAPTPSTDTKVRSKKEHDRDEWEDAKEEEERNPAVVSPAGTTWRDEGPCFLEFLTDLRENKVLLIVLHKRTGKLLLRQPGTLCVLCMCVASAWCVVACMCVSDAYVLCFQLLCS